MVRKLKDYRLEEIARINLNFDDTCSFLLPFLDDTLQDAIFAAKTPNAMANPMAKSTAQTAITVNPRSSVDRLFHHVGFLKQNKMLNTIV